MKDTIDVLVVDDSPFMRRVILNMLNSEPGIRVIDTAGSGLSALEKIKNLEPDVVTLDVEMPGIDGLGVLERLMESRPVPVVMLSSLTQVGADTTIKALELGAVDFVPKPSGPLSFNLNAVRNELVAKVKAASVARVHKRVRALLHSGRTEEGLRRSQSAQAQGRPDSLAKAGRAVVIGSSTGGPSALGQVLPRLSADIPAGVLVVQHMPPGFTRSLAARLNEASKIPVREAEEGDVVSEGATLVAPGGYHMVVARDRTVRLSQERPRHGVRPSVDVTLESAAEAFGRNLVGVIMTGMGSDGAYGISCLKREGGKAIAEHESTCVVYGMPKAVVESGNVDKVVPLPGIADEIMKTLQDLNATRPVEEGKGSRSGKHE